MSSLLSSQFFELRQVVGDLEPRRLRADEDVAGRADARLVHERAHSDVDVLAVAHDREQKRTALRAARVILVLSPDDEEGVGAFRDLEPLPLDTRVWLERRAGCGPAPRAVA